MSIGGYGPTIIAVMWTETAIALVFVLLRLWTRLRINYATGWDDYLLVITWVSNVPYHLPTTVANTE